MHRSELGALDRRTDGRIARAAVGMPHGDPHGYGYGVDMGMIFYPHRPMGILWGFLINLK